MDGRPAREGTGSGFTLIELLIVIVILGFLATIVVFAVRGIREDAQVSTCHQHRRVVATAIESYFSYSDSNFIPPTGLNDADRFERTVVAGGFMRSISVYFDADADGRLFPSPGSPCT